MKTITTDIYLTGEFIVRALKESETHNLSSIVRLSNVALGLAPMTGEDEIERSRRRGA